VKPASLLVGVLQRVGTLLKIAATQGPPLMARVLQLQDSAESINTPP